MAGKRPKPSDVVRVDADEAIAAELKRQKYENLRSRALEISSGLPGEVHDMPTYLLIRDLATTVARLYIEVDELRAQVSQVSAQR